MVAICQTLEGVQLAVEKNVGYRNFPAECRRFGTATSQDIFGTFLIMPKVSIFVFFAERKKKKNLIGVRGQNGSLQDYTGGRVGINERELH